MELLRLLQFNTFILLHLLIFIQSSMCFEYFKEKPSYIETCKINQPGFTKCSTRSIQAFLVEIFNGKVPEVNAVVGQLEPMKLDKINFKQDDNEAATIRATLSDLMVTGLSKIQVKESRVSKKNSGWLTKLFFPNFKIEGQYKMDGRILLLPLNGEGHMFIEIDSMNITMRTKTHVIEKDGFLFNNVTDVQVEVDAKKMSSQFDNLFGGHNKEIERSTNESFNKNWRDFFEALRPLITETVANIMFQLIPKIFLMYPATFFIEDLPMPQKP
ncbi:circadian clock-controlled protein daywake [Stomoxys calcitrans]|uniref:Hemolymph juvenile hormone binding protein n=1 Tax=Stomoxys calcitrans TaxID=35570 RepID=A0A1I8NLP1_STOCA|nr:circadian clock-controlled protein daywake [Stomoxys calcitrans]